MGEADGAVEHDRLRAGPWHERHLRLGLGAEIGQCQGAGFAAAAAAGWDAVEAPVRGNAAQLLARGTVYGTLTVERQGVAPVVRVNEPVLAAVLATLKGLQPGGCRPPSRDSTEFWR